MNKHLAQSSLGISDVAQGDCSDDLPAVCCNPEITFTLAVEAFNIKQVGLFVERDGNRKLTGLNADDEGVDVGLKGVVMRNDFHELKDVTACPLAAKRKRGRG